MADSSKLSIGRKKEIDIKLAEDISVSRHHANLLYDFEGKRFLL
jgi:pSer/pThr/pTyr-binding forkhead associated (FHA) protein